MPRVQVAREAVRAGPAINVLVRHLPALTAGRTPARAPGPNPARAPANLIHQPIALTARIGGGLHLPAGVVPCDHLHVAPEPAALFELVAHTLELSDLVL